jgi:hypothetical protein
MKGLVGRTAACLLLALTCEPLVLQPVWAQQANPAFGLRLVVENSSRSTPVKMVAPEPPVVFVEDRNGAPVTNALVIFTAPERGASGVFEDGSRTKTVASDRNGKAVGIGFRANGTQGTYEIQVRAQFLGEVAVSKVSHTNIAGQKSSKKLIAILAIAGAGAAGVILKGGGNGGSSDSRSTLPTITFGGATVGAPNP